MSLPKRYHDFRNYLLISGVVLIVITFISHDMISALFSGFLLLFIFFLFKMIDLVYVLERIYKTMNSSEVKPHPDHIELQKKEDKTGVFYTRKERE